MKNKKSKPDEAKIEERTEIWKQIIITTGVVIVALIGSWQAIAIVQLNNRSPTPAPSEVSVKATDTPPLLEATNTSQPAGPVAVVAAPQLPSPTNTAPAISLNWKPLHIDLSKWYRLTNESLGKDYSLDHWAATKDIVMNATGFLSGQYWGFQVSTPGFYTLASEYYGLDIVLNILTDNNNSLTVSPGNGDLKGKYWKVSSSGGNCVRFTSQDFGDNLSLDLTTINNVPTPYMAQTSDTQTQCWHLSPVGNIK